MNTVDAEGYERHSFVWLDTLAPATDLSTSSQADRHVLSQWIIDGSPVIRTRRRPTTETGRIDLGLALPLSQDKKLLAFTAPENTVKRKCPPPLLSELISCVPVLWKAAVGSLVAASQSAAIEYRVYGSFAWQHLTGLNYVSPVSDIDLVWKPATEAQLLGGIRLLQSHERKFRKRFDGEIVLPDASAVAWRELAAQPKKVLAKTSGEASLRRIEDLFRLFSSSLT